jgi:hypothetical protein
MTAGDPTLETPVVKRAVRPHVDLTGERPLNTADGLMNWIVRVFRANPNVIVDTYVNDCGDPADFVPFYIVPRALIRELCTAAGVDSKNIPTHRDRADLTLITKEA